MRPVLRGPWPTNADGSRKSYAVYGNAKPDLFDRLDAYCSYCERPLKTAEAEVEHMLPKNRYPDDESNWENYLLACKACNTKKGNKDTRPLADFVWPDRDSTLACFLYEVDGTVSAAPGLDPQLRTRAQASLDLLDAGFSNQINSFADDRYEQRLRALGIIRIAQHSLQEQDSPSVRLLVLELARATGFWSIWIACFGQDADLRQRLIQAWRGTDESRL